MAFTCGHCPQNHPTVAHAKLAHGRPASQGPAISPPSPGIPAHFSKPATAKQLEFISKLGGDMTFAAQLDISKASDYIDRLKKERDNMNCEAPNRTKTKIPMAMLEKLEAGYYAVKNGDEPYRFYRISRPKTGKFAGTIKIQSQHGENYSLVLAIWPSGTLRWWNVSAEDDVLILCVNSRAAALAYGQFIGRCCRCNKELTDERSRWYGIGPECEKFWPHILDMIAASKGDYVPV